LLLLFFVWDLLMDHFQQLLRQEGLFLCHLATAAVAELEISLVGAADRSLHATIPPCLSRTDAGSIEKGHTDTRSDTVTSLNFVQLKVAQTAPAPSQSACKTPLLD
jgi:hypothetical protein